MPKTLLLADDSRTIQQAVNMTFAGEDVKLITASDGEAALQAAKQSKPDLILADVTMPKLSGYELCQRVRGEASLKDVPVLLLGGPAPIDPASSAGRPEARPIRSAAGTETAAAPRETARAGRARCQAHRAPGVEAAASAAAAVAASGRLASAPSGGASLRRRGHTARRGSGRRDCNADTDAAAARTLGGAQACSQRGSSSG